MHSNGYGHRVVLSPMADSPYGGPAVRPISPMYYAVSAARLCSVLCVAYPLTVHLTAGFELPAPRPASYTSAQCAAGQSTFGGLA